MISEKKTENLDHSAVRLTVTISAEQTSKEYDKVLGEYRKHARIPGFRPGKVPRDVLVRKFNKSINQETAVSLVDSGIKDALKDAAQRPISEPLVKELPPLEHGSPYEFSADYDVFPEIKMGEYKQVKITVPRVIIKKEHENDELENIRERNAVVVDAVGGAVAEGSVVTMDYVELGEEGDPREETRRKDFSFIVGRNSHPYGIEKDLEGMKVGDSKVVETRPEEDSESPIKLSVSISAVKERKLPDLDDELAQDVSDNLKTLSDLHKKVKNDLKQRADERIRMQQLRDITDSIVDSSGIDLPRSMVNGALEDLWQNHIRENHPSEGHLKELESKKDDILAEWSENVEKSIKVPLLYDKIIELEGLTVQDDEVKAELTKRAGELQMSVDELNNVYGERKLSEHIKKEVLNRKLFDFLLDAASIKKDGKIDYNDLMSA